MLSDDSEETLIRGIKPKLWTPVSGGTPIATKTLRIRCEYAGRGLIGTPMQCHGFMLSPMRATCATCFFLRTDMILNGDYVK